jgi:hypothetical protein
VLSDREKAPEYKYEDFQDSSGKPQRNATAKSAGNPIGGARLDSSTPRKLGNCEFF